MNRHSIRYNNRDQLTSIGGVTMDYRDLGNDLRRSVGSDRMVTGPLGITAVNNNTGTMFYTRDPHGTILNSHDSTGGAVNYVTARDARPRMCSCPAR